MPSTSLSMPGLRLGKRQSRVVKWVVLLTDPIRSPPPPAAPGVSPCPISSGVHLGCSRRGQHSVAVKERQGQVTWLKPRSCFWRPLELPELGFTPEMRPDAALQGDTGALGDGWDREAYVSYEMERWVCGHVTKPLYF